MNLITPSLQRLKTANLRSIVIGLKPIVFTFRRCQRRKQMQFSSSNLPSLSWFCFSVISLILSLNRVRSSTMLEDTRYLSIVNSIPTKPLPNKIPPNGHVPWHTPFNAGPPPSPLSPTPQQYLSGHSPYSHILPPPSRFVPVKWKWTEEILPRAGSWAGTWDVWGGGAHPSCPCHGILPTPIYHAEESDIQVDWPICIDMSDDAKPKTELSGDFEDKTLKCKVSFRYMNVRYFLKYSQRN